MWAKILFSSCNFFKKKLRFQICHSVGSLISADKFLSSWKLGQSFGLSCSSFSIKAQYLSGWLIVIAYWTQCYIGIGVSYKIPLFSLLLEILYFFYTSPPWFSSLYNCKLFKEVTVWALAFIGTIFHYIVWVFLVTFSHIRCLWVVSICYICSIPHWFYDVTIHQGVQLMLGIYQEGYSSPLVWDRNTLASMRGIFRLN